MTLSSRLKKDITNFTYTFLPLISPDYLQYIKPQSSILVKIYDLAAYFAAYHTSIDCFNKRGVKGVFITIGDELYYNEVNPEHVARVVGDNLEAPIPIKTLVQDVQKTFEWFHILANRPVGYGTRNLEAWEDLLGPERVVVLDDPKDICEVITKIILGHEAGLSANRVNPPEEASAAPQSGTKRI